MPSATYPLKQLIAAVSAAAAVAPARTTKDILKCIRFWIRGDGRTELVATDSEVSLVRVVEHQEATDPATLLIDAAKLTRLLRELSGETVTLTATKSGVDIEAGFSFFQLNTESAADFPAVSIEPPEDAIVIPAAPLCRILERTVFASDVQSSRYALGGVELAWDGLRLVAAATDSRRLSVATELATSESVAVGPLGVVPQRAVRALLATLGHAEGPVRVGVVGNAVVFATDTVRLSAQTIQGRFPDWKRVVPSATRLQVDLVAAPFHSAIRQSQIMTNEESAGVAFTLEAGKLRLNSQAADVGASKIEVPISYDREPLTVTFQPAYIAEFLRQLEPATPVSLRLNGREEAALFVVGDEYRYVVMPLSND